MNVTGPGRYKLRQVTNFWQWAKHAWLYSELLQALKAEHLSVLGSQQRRTLKKKKKKKKNSASTGGRDRHRMTRGGEGVCFFFFFGGGGWGEGGREI